MTSPPSSRRGAAPALRGSVLRSVLRSLGVEPGASGGSASKRARGRTSSLRPGRLARAATKVEPGQPGAAKVEPKVELAPPVVPLGLQGAASDEASPASPASVPAEAGVPLHADGRFDFGSAVLAGWPSWCGTMVRNHWEELGPPPALVG